MCRFFYNKRSVLLNVRAGRRYADATLGHGRAFAGDCAKAGRQRPVDRLRPRSGGDGDCDGEGSTRSAKSWARRCRQVDLHTEPFSMAKTLIEPASLDGLLADFGVSSLQLGEAHRGFSFQADGPLDMRQDTRRGVTAEQVVNQAGRKRTRRPDLRIRRGKEVAENRQSHCQGAADHDDGGNLPGSYRLPPRR